MASARVGGIKANNDEPVEFLLENLQIQNNIIHAAHENGVRKLLFLGSSCIYPKLAPQPIPESALLGGPLEPTNEAYAIAKIAGIKLCQAYVREYGANFISAMPTNLYGPNDNFDLEKSHVLAALLRKAHEAKESGASEIVVWGSGEPRREFLHVDDLASACLFLLQNYDSSEIINIGTGTDLTIRELAELICEVVGFDGELSWDRSRPDGTPRKLLDVSKISSLGWQAKIPLREGIARTYDWYQSPSPLTPEGRASARPKPIAAPTANLRCAEARPCTDRVANSECCQLESEIRRKYPESALEFRCNRGRVRCCRCRRQRLIKPQRLDIAAEFAQGIVAFGGAGAGVADEVVEAVFAGDDDKVGDPAAETHAHDDGVAAGEVGIDQGVGWQVFVDLPDTVGRPPGGAVPVKPALVGVTAHGGEKPVELLRVGLDAVGLEDHRGRGDRAAGFAEGTILGHAAERVVTPSCVALTE